MSEIPKPGKEYIKLDYSYYEEEVKDAQAKIAIIEKNLQTQIQRLEKIRKEIESNLKIKPGSKEFRGYAERMWSLRRSFESAKATIESLRGSKEMFGQAIEYWEALHNELAKYLIEFEGPKQ